jgi:hypothetical protein
MNSSPFFLQFLRSGSRRSGDIGKKGWRIGSDLGLGFRGKRGDGVHLNRQKKGTRWPGLVLGPKG